MDKDRIKANMRRYIRVFRYKKREVKPWIFRWAQKS